MGIVGYLTAEIGLWSELHTYSGGLGVLAGDHVKSAADAEINLVGITLLYREGYGRQHIDEEGNQSESFGAIDPEDHLSDTGIELSIPLDSGNLKIIYRGYVNNPGLISKGAGGDLDKVEEEDQQIVESVQRGVHSESYKRGRYSPEKESGVHHFHRILLKNINRIIPL